MAMWLCENGHDQVCHEGHDCPACALRIERDALREEIGRLERELAEREEEARQLREGER